VAVALLTATWLVGRSCGYEFGTVAVYAAYFGFYVMLPGFVVLQLLERRPLTLSMAVALGVPVGFAVEILSFLGLSALQLRGLMPVLPAVWLGLGAWRWVQRREWPCRLRLGHRHAPLMLALSVLFLATVVAAVCQMFAESPLVDGLPQRPIFHDWVYLASRAAAIKHHWPLEDPSLAGSSLQYHYFMLVHAASASWLANLEVTMVLLRLMIVPLGGVLVVQAFVLGRMVSRSAWGGVLAAVLTTVVSEASLAPDYGRPMFLGLFVRWLYVSPTFFFGMIFFGALLIAVARGVLARRLDWPQVALLALLAAAGTGAKGTVLPVLLLALGLLGAWWWLRQRRFPGRLVGIATAMGAAFAVVYLLTMSQWGSGDAELQPWKVFHVTQFWQQHADTWVAAVKAPFKKWLHLPRVGIWLAEIACAAVVIAGTSGVRLFAIPYLLRGDPRHRGNVAAWLGAAFLASCAMGTIIHLDSNGELYLILLIRLPLAVLSAAFMVSVAGRLRRWWGRRKGEITTPAGLTIDPFGRPADPGLAAPAWPARLLAAGVIVVTGATLAIQTNLWITRNRPGFAAWMRMDARVAVNDELLPLYDAMFWIRRHTEPNAVLVANAFTQRNLRHGRGVLVDHTTAGVHYYYSALSERRLWVEGPSYQLDFQRMRRRMAIAAKVFYGGLTPSRAMFSVQPSYVVIDHSVGDGAKVALPSSARVFANSRFEIYRVPPRTKSTPAAAAPVAAAAQ
jgi:hypothetical protein